MEFEKIVKLTVLKKTFLKSKKDGKEYNVISVYDYTNNDFRRAYITKDIYNSVEEGKNYNFNIAYTVYTNGNIKFNIIQKV